MDVSGKVVFITGAAQGLGKGMAEAVLKKGAKVCIGDVQEDKGKEIVEGFQKDFGKDKALFVTCDVTKEKQFSEAFQTAVSHFGQVDVMVNNAGIMNEIPWEKMIDINVAGVVRGTNMALAHMRKDKGGKGGVILNTASVAGLVPGHWLPVYVGTKHAVVGFTKSWAENPAMKEACVRLACLCPTAADTNLLNLTEGMVMNVKDFNETIHKHVVCTVEQVVDGFKKLLEEEDNNGSLLVVSAAHGAVYMQTPLVPVEAKKD